MPIYAGFWLRLLAYLIDYTIVELLVGAVSWLFASGANTVGDLWASGLLGMLVGLFYWAGLESSRWQATLGKRAVGIRVTDLDGRRISFPRALGRTLAKLLSTLIFMIGYLMAGWTERKQALHDLIAGTLVVRGHAPPPEPPPLMSGPAPERPTPR
jgi:uncharacterized RDD family membrane protein YckC